MNDLSEADIDEAFKVFDADGTGVLELSEVIRELRVDATTGFTRRVDVASREALPGEGGRSKRTLRTRSASRAALA